MRRFLIGLGTASLTAVLVACGGGGDDPPDFERLVVFGDSLSDVGSYRTAGVAAAGGGKFTINGASGAVWVELVAEDRRLAPPCAAQTGLQASGLLAGLAQTTTNAAACYGYAQGGSRVTNPIGPYNAALLNPPFSSQQGQLGQLTVPVATQIASHLAKGGGSFDDDELVTVLAGGNDVFMNLALAAASAITPEQAVDFMAVAGAELAVLVREEILDNGARYVIVVNLPDVSRTPFAYGQNQFTQGLLADMSLAFNDALADGLEGEDILRVDAYTRSRAQAANPASFGIANATTPACDPADTVVNGFPLNSLVCNASTLIAGNVSAYQFADDVHPTPFGHALIADYVLERMSDAGWR